MFPEHLKKAIVIPLHNSGNFDDPNILRPTSILPSIIRLFKKNFRSNKQISRQKQGSFSKTARLQKKNIHDQRSGHANV